MENKEKITYLGYSDYRNKMTKFGIKEKDRTRHMYVIGMTGMGKSTLLENMAIQDIQNGEGIIFMDPHGGTAKKLLDFVPEERKKDVIYFAPFDVEHPIAFNVLEKVDDNKRYLVADGLMAAFKKVFGEEKFSDRIQYILNNSILTLLENEGETLMGINRLLSDKNYRKKMVENVKDPAIKTFWNEEYAKAGEKYQQDAAPGIQNKIGQFTSNPLIRNIIGQKKTSFDIRDIMDNKKILIVNLSIGEMGVGNSNLMGSLLITKIYLSAMGRAEVEDNVLQKLPPIYFYVDEFQNFANDSFANILSQARKYKLALIVAHQYVDQMTEEIKSAIFGNVGTKITFRVGGQTDAETFEREFAPVFTADDFTNIAAFQMYLRLMINNEGSRAFSAKAMPPIEKPEISYAKEIIEYNREVYGKPKEEIEKEITEWFQPVIFNNTENKDTFQDKKTNKESYYINNRQNIERKENNTKNNNHLRTKRDDYKKERDIVNTNFNKIKEEIKESKEEKTNNNNSLKEALEKAIKTQNNLTKNNIQNQNINNKVKNDENNNINNDNFLKEIDEKTLKNIIEKE